MALGKRMLPGSLCGSHRAGYAIIFQKGSKTTLKLASLIQPDLGWSSEDAQPVLVPLVSTIFRAPSLEENRLVEKSSSVQHGQCNIELPSGISEVLQVHQVVSIETIRTKARSRSSWMFRRCSTSTNITSPKLCVFDGTVRGSRKTQHANQSVS